ncbi:MAG: hypothetical protein K5751_05350 [Treponemataceae bacterium]|nr:hypothetical protein [Treponemataceae bacterium]
MNSKIKAAIIFVIYTFLVFLFSILWFIFFSDASKVLPPDQFAYKFDNGVIYFFMLIPPVLMTAEIFGFSWFFGVSSLGTKKRFSNKMLGHLKTVLITCVSCVIVCFVSEEALIPSIQNAVSLYEARARNYWEYTELAEEYSKSGSFNNARFYAEEALKLYPGSPEAKSLALRMERESLEANSAENMSNTVADEKNDFIQMQNEELSYSYLTEAEKAFAAADYINAHYYAEMAAKSTERNGQNLLRAKEISSVSWGLLNSDKNTFNKESGDVYKLKKEAYNALENGDVLKAYYMLIKLNDAYPNDPDIANYFEETVNRLENQYFFVDETDDLRDFETANNVFFSVTKPDGQVDLIFIGGISVVENTGQFIQYFRNFSVTSFSEEGHVKQFFSVPYAKMTAQLVSSLVESGLVSTKREFKTSNDQYVPYVFLEGIDRQSDNTRNAIKPKFKYRMEEEAPSFYIIDIPFGDLTLIRQACEGADKMPFISLMQFISKAAHYGFSNEVYTAAFAKRACYPFIILAIMITLAIMSFNYRLLSGHAFRFHWLLLFPMMTIILRFAMMLIDYVESLLAISLYSAAGSACPAAMIFLSIALVVIVSFRFLSSHSE